MSISPNVGAISTTLGRIVADPRTNKLREKIKGMTFALGGVFGEGVVDFAKNVEESVRSSASATSARSTAMTFPSCATRSSSCAA